jgi:hypothetical protein
MKTADEIENDKVGSIVAGRSLKESVDALLSRLLLTEAGYSSRSTDGLLFEHSYIAGHRAVASGVVVRLQPNDRASAC